jgi:NAD(P)-dependent dehydrogenase (short-subunit alcohol dehydrogenase family)
MSVFDLDGRKALITGSARGLGQGMAEALAQAGAAVMITDVLDELGAETAQLIAKSGATAGYTHLDVTDEAGWEQAVATTVEELGGLDILVNNAGLEISALVSELDVDALRRMLDVNIVGTALGMKHGLRAMRPGGAAGNGGSIINIASVAALIAFPGIAGYSATKSAVDRMTRIAAAEAGKLGYGVRVNCVYPGLVPTTQMGLGLAEQAVALGLFPSIEACAETVVGMTPAGRLGEIPEIADAVLFLASDAARYVTGTGLAVDGGLGS